jgi:UDP-GlcNAc:undecaprenyl-phosphate GlcNAc-1-phosphate transferase
MGDAGSMWLGLVLGWFMAQVAGDAIDAEPAIVLWLFGIPLMDTLTVMIRRKRRKASMFDPDRTHIHHVLEDTGLTIKKAVILLSGIQVIMVGMGVLFFMTHAPAALVFWGFVAFFAAYYYRLRNA